MEGYATYLRVSTQKQGRSGLGLDAQRRMCSDFITQNHGMFLAEFCDVESGTHRDRKGLQDAIAFCMSNGCALVIAKLDRLARDVEFCFKVINTGVDIHFTDMPQINTLLLGVFASVAQYERELTSDRTRKALAVKKASGEKLGAASEKYKAAIAAKDKESKRDVQCRKGMTKRERWRARRDTQAVIHAIRNVFPKAANGEPTDWDWSCINGNIENAQAIAQRLREYKDFEKDGTLFKDWAFGNSEYDVAKVRSYIHSLKRSARPQRIY